MMAKIVVRVADPANTYTQGNTIITGYTPKEVEQTKEVMLAIENGLLVREKNVLPHSVPSSSETKSSTKSDTKSTEKSSSSSSSKGKKS